MPSQSLFLRTYVLIKNFLWHAKPPKGRSGGMLIGINLLTFDVGEIEEGEYFVRFKIRNKEDDFKWNLVSIYGAAQHEQKEAFLMELVQLCTKETLPTILGGDFNIVHGLSCLMQSLMRLTIENWQCHAGNLLGQIICKTRPLKN